MDIYELIGDDIDAVYRRLVNLQKLHLLIGNYAANNDDMILRKLQEAGDVITCEAFEKIRDLKADIDKLKNK